MSVEGMKLGNCRVSILKLVHVACFRQRHQKLCSQVLLFFSPTPLFCVYSVFIGLNVKLVFEFCFSEIANFILF